MLAALTFIFPFPAGGLFVLTPVEAVFDVFAMPRACAGFPVDAGIGFLVGAGLPFGTGFFVYAVDGRELVLGVGAGRAFCAALGAPMGFEPCDLTCFVAAADGLGCAEAGRTFLDRFVT